MSVYASNRNEDQKMYQSLQELGLLFLKTAVFGRGRWRQFSTRLDKCIKQNVDLHYEVYLGLAQSKCLSSCTSFIVDQCSLVYLFTCWCTLSLFFKLSKDSLRIKCEWKKKQNCRILHLTVVDKPYNSTVNEPSTVKYISQQLFSNLREL